MDIGEARVGADFDVVLLAGADGFLHDQRIAGVKAASYVGVVCVDG